MKEILKFIIIIIAGIMLISGAILFTFTLCNRIHPFPVVFGIENRFILAFIGFLAAFIGRALLELID